MGPALAFGAAGGIVPTLRKEREECREAWWVMMGRKK
jgi:hypothetical protein